MPDFILLLGNPDRSAAAWSVVEMKTTIEHVDDIREQLQSGADQIRTNPSYAIVRPPRLLLPLVLHSRGGKTSDFDVLRSPRRGISFDGKKIPVIVHRSPYMMDASSILSLATQPRVPQSVKPRKKSR